MPGSRRERARTIIWALVSILPFFSKVSRYLTCSIVWGAGRRSEISQIARNEGTSKDDVNPSGSRNGFLAKLFSWVAAFWANFRRPSILVSIV